MVVTIKSFLEDILTFSYEIEEDVRSHMPKEFEESSGFGLKTFLFSDKVSIFNMLLGFYSFIIVVLQDSGNKHLLDFQVILFPDYRNYSLFRN